MKTRREFVKQGLLAGATIALSSACRFPRGDRPRIDTDSIENLRSSFSGQLILPEDEVYDSARSVYWRNASTDKRPALIARCAVPTDVARCIEFAADKDLVLAVRGGGHSFLGWGTCDDGLAAR